MNYLSRLHSLKAEKRPSPEPSKPSKPGSEGFEGGPDRHFSGDRPAYWIAKLAAFSPYQPRSGIVADRWRTLLADARWLAECHGEAAAALGWTASDLFGLDPLPGWGGLADRLDGARHLALTDRIAHWRDDDLEGWLWRRTLRPMPTLWEFAR